MQSELPDLHIFACVVEAENFRDAARQLQMARSSVSKRISRLEEELGVVLFNRSTRRISLTDAGQILYRYWGTIAANVNEAIAAVRDIDDTPTGRLRVSMPTAIGAALTPAIVQDFQSAWPDLKTDLDFSELPVDIVGDGYDVVIRFAGKLPDSRLTARRLATTRNVLVASPGYLEREGVPRKLKDLKQHRCLGLGFRIGQKTTWTFASGRTTVEINLTATLSANNDLALILAACLDSGIYYLPQLLIESEVRSGRLSIINLNDVRGKDCGIFAIYPQSKPSAKVKVFVDFVAEHLERAADMDRWTPLRTQK